MTTGLLFRSEARSKFIATTGDRFRHMRDRHAKKKLPPPAFTLDDLRDHLLLMMGGRYDGGIRCRYCRETFLIADIELDHAIPFARGGTGTLENIEAPCAACNGAKAEMLPEEYEALREFLETKIPFARVDILKRLSEHSKLVAAKRMAEMLSRNQGQFPKKTRRGVPPMTRAMEEAF